jgi:hypothetical protein
MEDTYGEALRRKGAGGLTSAIESGRQAIEPEDSTISTIILA